MPKIIAVVLTYNRQELLERCLQAVYSQTLRCDEVFVIDNASTDSTQDMLSSLHYPNLKVHVLSNNLGAAGGFNTGFRLAYQSGADFVWMMDDDVIPESTALEQLLDAKELLSKQSIEYSYLLSTAFTESGLITNTPEVSKQKNSIGYQSWPLLAEHGIITVRRGTFVSILVPRYTLETFGVPITDMFIWGEDAEYTLRITHSTPGFLVGKSRVQHVRQNGGSISILSEDNPARIKYYKHFIRNNIYMARKYRSSSRLISVVFHNFSLIIKLLSRKQYRKAKVVMQGIISCIHFTPKVEAASSPIDESIVSVRSSQAMHAKSDATLNVEKKKLKADLWDSELAQQQ